MNPETICRLLAEPERVKTYAAVALGATSPSAVAQATGLVARDVVRALGVLTDRGLVTEHGGVLAADLSVFKTAVRDNLTAAPAERLDPDDNRDAVLRAFVTDGRLVSIPAARGKRRVVLEHLAACFEPGVRYPERAVDAVLRAWYHDYASLRRYLVDEELMSREHGIYWRTGGPVDI
ncbi:DUF2087 domain-containing protein [Actinocatenispora comari]|jgi:hypothetical protein|uniref:DUF2087 domain-containing protein n=1 Tax=Actinocatenispora comari TaxID=2807577 RepID=A0A8J4AGU3_9ACTN|nr:DUF2087 domain-containing protein [Actinocatenispora comari]GIL28428.1 hypothetical protein NUM_36820 [Actinocatenispora comari]